MSNKKVKPTITITEVTADSVLSKNNPIEKGVYTLVALKNGEEFGQEFTVTARQYHKTYSNTKRFKVKKNPQQ